MEVDCRSTAYQCGGVCTLLYKESTRCHFKLPFTIPRDASTHVFYKFRFHSLKYIKSLRRDSHFIIPESLVYHNIIYIYFLNLLPCFDLVTSIHRLCRLEHKYNFHSKRQKKERKM